MKIAGVDSSTSSPAIVKMDLDENLEIISVDYLGFNSANLKKINDKIQNSKEFKFKNEIDRNIILTKIVGNFINGCDYMAIEGYSYGSIGRLAQLAEFASLIKTDAYKNGVKIKIYDVNSIKKNATGKGNADKLEMYEAFINSELSKFIKFDEKFPELTEKKRKSGVSPLSDIVDAAWICEFLRLELRLRKGMVYLKDLSEEKISIFNRVTKGNPVNILDTPFLGNY